MKTMLRRLRRFLVGGALVLAACDDPIDRDSGEKLAPAVVDVYFNDSLAYGGASEFLESDPTSFQHLFETVPNVPATNAILPFNHPRLIFNKLLNGDTLEIAEPEQTFTHGKKLLGFCKPATPAAVVLSDGSADVENLKTCYSPSDKFLTVQPAIADGTAINFLEYGATYTISTTANAKDKKGVSVKAFSADFTVRPFELLLASDEIGAQYFYASDAYGGPGALEDPDAGGVVVDPSTTIIRLVFSGPIGVVTDDNGTPDDPDDDIVVSDPAADLQFRDGDGLPVKAIDADNNEVQALFSQTDPTGGVSAADPRVMYLYHPSYLIGDENAGFAPGTYTLTIPATFADNGTVTGDRVAIGQEVTVTFVVPEPEE